MRQRKALLAHLLLAALRRIRLGIDALMIAASMTAPTTSLADCSILAGTADGWNKNDATTGAQEALKEAISEWKATNNVDIHSVTAIRPEPRPYWRSKVAPHLFLEPDIVTNESHTTCWRGVVSPVVCTSGAKVCW
jgi:hypothetical protein